MCVSVCIGAELTFVPFLYPAPPFHREPNSPLMLILIQNSKKQW